MVWRVGEWTVYPSSAELQRGAERVKIDPRAMAVLVHLIERAGAVVSPDELLDAVWKDVVVTQSSVYKAITQLRRAFDDDSREPRYVRNVPKLGYQLIAAVTPLPDAQHGAAAPAAAEQDPAHAVAGWPGNVPASFEGLTVLRAIGAGAHGDVFLAREHALERLVAVKVLRPEIAADAVASARFAREAQAAARIRDPHVASVHRVVTRPDGAPCLIMEYVDGRSLADPLARERAGESVECARIVAGLARALAAADARGVIHRDVKPANVLVERGTNRVVLTDFGVAGFAEGGRDAGPRLTRVGDSLGDPRYTSPERIRGEAATAASDVYSLGVIAYELLLGHGPHGATPAHAVAEAHVSGTLVDLAALRPDVPVSFARALERCVARRAEERPTAQELVTLLDAAPTTDAARVAPAPRVGAAVRRGPLGVPAALAAALAVVVALAAAWAWSAA